MPSYAEFGKQRVHWSQRNDSPLLPLTRFGNHWRRIPQVRIGILENLALDRNELSGLEWMTLGFTIQGV